jgi:hypothetical protein
MINRRCVRYFFMVVVVRYETKAPARRTLMFIVGAFIKYTITIAVRASFHVCLRSILALGQKRTQAPQQGTSITNDVPPS